jgi:hypothetical protein
VTNRQIPSSANSVAFIQYVTLFVFPSLSSVLPHCRKGENGGRDSRVPQQRVHEVRQALEVRPQAELLVQVGHAFDTPDQRRYILHHGTYGRCSAAIEALDRGMRKSRIIVSATPAAVALNGVGFDDPDLPSLMEAVLQRRWALLPTERPDLAPERTRCSIVDAPLRKCARCANFVVS